MKSYEEMLDRAYERLPEKTESSERFELPTAEIQVEGKKTIIRNFKEMASTLHRDLQMMAKYITKELAVPGDVDGPRLIIKARIPPRIIHKKVDDFMKTFVLCKECGKPDTKIMDFGGVKQLKCEACGARHPLPELK